MDLNWSDEELAFADEVREFLAAELTPELQRAGSLLTSVYSGRETALAWQRKLHARGWAAPAWPERFGGRGWPAGKRYIFAREMARAAAPPLSPIGLGMCGPVLIGHGSPEQQARFLPRILSGEDFWCQGYSEPGSGSDLASLQMSAVVDGDELVCNGHKLWTTYAHQSNWIFCLVRTSKEDIPQKGITFLLIDMATPGVEVHPIVFLTGEHIQNHVYFTDVRVPLANVVGKIGEGWTVAKYLMEFERGGGVSAPGIIQRLNRLARALEAEFGLQPSGEGAVLRRRLATAMIQAESLEAIELRTLSRLAAGERPGPESSMLKVLSSELAQQVTEIALDAAGHYAAPYQPHAAAPGGPTPGFRAPSDNALVGPEHSWAAASRYFNERAGSIYAGTNEIQRNIMARAVLGL